MKIKILLLTLAALVLTSCVRSYRISIDSINDRSAQPGKTFIVVPGNKDTSAGDLQFKEFAYYLVKALDPQGYRLSEDQKTADIEIYLSYGVGDPEKHTYSYYEPVWGQTGMQIYTRTDNVTNSDSTTSQYSSTYVEPQYGVTGYTTQTGEVTLYKKYAIIDAYDIKNGSKGTKLKQVWKTSVSSSGQTKDLRKTFPFLMAGAAQYAGSNTGEEINVVIGEDSETVKAIKGK